MGAGFAARPATPAAADESLSSAIAKSLSECNEEERFLLASYYLDGQTLAEIGRQLRAHESTVSRKLARLTGELRKKVRRCLLAAGVCGRSCDELLTGLDVRHLNVDVKAILRQESPQLPFYKVAAVFRKGGRPRDAT